MKGLSLEYAFRIFLLFALIMIAVGIMFSFFKQKKWEIPTPTLDGSYSCYFYDKGTVNAEEIKGVIYGFIKNECTKFQAKVNGKITFDDIKNIIREIDSEKNVVQLSDCFSSNINTNTIYIGFESIENDYISMLSKPVMNNDILICKSTAPTTTSYTTSTSTIPSISMCPENKCLTNKPNKNGISYPRCNNKVKITGTNPTDPESCDSPKKMYEFIHDTSKPYIDPYDTTKFPQLKAEIENQLITIKILGMDISVNKKIAPKLKEVGDAIDSKYAHSDTTYYFSSGRYTFVNSGTYNFRENTNSPGILSSHAFGLSWDLNANTNWDNVLEPMACIVDIPPEVVEVFESRGFRWGGRYWPYFDPMHFEYLPDCIVN